jgi:hypothetical protein
MYWSDLLKHHFPNWAHKKIESWNYEAGICLGDELSIRDQLSLAVDKGNPIDAGHKARFLAENIFKDICEFYDVLLPFRQGQGNDRRKLQDLITAVQHHFGKNNRFDSKQSPLIDIKNCLWLMNIASHPDPRQLNLVINDVNLIINDLDLLETLFYNHSAGCPHMSKRLVWDKRNKIFLPCTICNKPI